jgi:2-polyprenyl-3-methyl-5-hydroxy-6-metoxy-1,4-benzoquinol methylase
VVDVSYTAEDHQFRESDDYARAKYDITLRWLGPARGRSLLNIGCGGGMFNRLASDAGFAVEACEPDPVAHAAAVESAPEGVTVHLGGLLDSSMTEGADVVVMHDVLEHIEDEAAAVDALCRLVDAKGTLIVSVPALQSLFGMHDERLGHFRRYDRRSLRRAFGSRLHIERMRYFGFSLIPVTLAYSRLLRRPYPTDAAAGPSLIGKAFGVVCRVESRVPAVLGTSLICEATLTAHGQPVRQMPSADQSDDWETHWDRFADSAEHNPAQEFRRRMIFSLLGELGSDARLIDIGCGQGDLLRDLRARYADATLVGIDQSASGLETAQRKVPTARLVQSDLLAGSAIPDDLRGWASAAICSEVLEHVDDPVRLLANAKQALAPDCRLIVTVPGGPRSAYDRHIGHRRHFDAAALRDVLLRAGYEPITIRRAGFPAFNAYKLLVIARGDRLVDDAQRGSEEGESRLTRLVMSAFRPLFRLTVRDFPFGWQLVATARAVPA